MIKYIKRAGIYFFAVVIICLLTASCFVLFSTSSTSDNSGIAEVASNATTTKTYPLTGGAIVCANTWNSAFTDNANTNNLKFTLMADWITNTNSFGSGDFFDNGRIKVGASTNGPPLSQRPYITVTVDLNGYKIANTTASNNVGIFSLSDDSKITFSVIDSSSAKTGELSCAGASAGGYAIYSEYIIVRLSGIKIKNVGTGLGLVGRDSSIENVEFSGCNTAISLGKRQVSSMTTYYASSSINSIKISNCNTGISVGNTNNSLTLAGSIIMEDISDYGIYFISTYSVIKFSAPLTANSKFDIGIASNSLTSYNGKAITSGFGQYNASIMQNLNISIKNSGYILEYDNNAKEYYVYEIQSFDKPTAGENTIEYSGTEIKYLPNLFSTESMAISGNIQTEVNTYEATISLTKLRYIWADGTRDDVKLPWSITKKQITQPSLSTKNINYNGNLITFIPNNYNDDYMAITNNENTKVGNYTAIVKLKDEKNTSWADGTTSQLEINYNIINANKLLPSAESGYDFLILEGNKRVTYSEKELIHGYNDSEITNFVLGNIAPNTSVNTLIDNLVFDLSTITICNGAGDVIYGANAKSYYTENFNNGVELAVGTGWYIEYTLENNESEKIYLSVLGDLTGDGKVNSADVNMLRKMVNDSEVYTDTKDFVKLSSLIINNGKQPTNADAEIVWNIACGKIDINDFI